MKFHEEVKFLLWGRVQPDVNAPEVVQVTVFNMHGQYFQQSVAHRISLVNILTVFANPEKYWRELDVNIKRAKYQTDRRR
jgi:hypothetical protein